MIPDHHAPTMADDTAGEQSIVCPYCGEPAVFVESAAVYKGRSYGMIYLCRPCAAWVGVHAGTRKPKGRLANDELRRWRKRAHAAFDPLWQAKMARQGCNKAVARGAGYTWLAAQLGLTVEACHIGAFDVATCQRVVDICQPYRRHA